MANKKNGFAGKSFQDIMIQQAQQSLDKPLYCRICGKDINVPSNTSAGGHNGDWKRNIDWERANQAHLSCAQKHMRRR